MAVAGAARVAMLVDAQQYFRAFWEAAQRAERSIVILAWDFSSRTRLVYDDLVDGRLPEGSDRATRDGVPVELGPFLNWLVHRRRRLHVRILDWDFPLIFGQDRELAPLYGLGWRPRRRVQLRFDNTHPVGGSHHQKVVVIDDRVAFVGGLDLTCRRWDTSEHLAGDPRRMAYGKPYPPFHDLTFVVDGDAARALGQVARDRWEIATGRTFPRVNVASDPWPESVTPAVRDVEVAVSRTSPQTPLGPPIREIERLYLDMIAAARKTIYIENQYFTSQTIADALRARLEEPGGPEIILVVRLLSHGWLEEHTMHVLRTRLITALREADREGRFHVYYPHTEGLAEGTCIDVHAKMIAVDDQWLRIGSANLCNRSMGMDTECDVTLQARGDPQVERVIRDFRLGLLAEHLGVTRDEVDAALGSTGSMHGAAEKLRCENRTLRVLDDLEPWSETVQTLAAVADPEKPVAVDDLMGELSLGQDEAGPRPAWAKIAGAAFVVIVLSAIWRYTPLADWVTPENMSSLARHFASQPWAPVALIAVYTPASVVLFPRPLITLAGVVAFGPWLGLGYALAGILIAAVLTYYVGRRMPRDTVRRIAGAKLNRTTRVLRQRGLIAITLLRLVPLAPFVVENFIAGAARIRLRDYIGGTILGMAPGLLAVTVFGKELEAALSGGGSIDYALVGGVVIAVVLLGFFVRRWFRRMERRAEADAAVAARR